ncbi:hypothetical protein [Lactobacillus taiwanensis]|nr:hypothetical protein [Lactobacillus taiwanensis]
MKKDKEKWKKILLLSLLVLLIPLLSACESEHKGKTYIGSAYVLIPKKKAYLYATPSQSIKYKSVNKIIIPANIAISKSVDYKPSRINAYFLDAENVHLDNKFNGGNVNYGSNLTQNMNYQYTPQIQNGYIKVGLINKLYKYDSTMFNSVMYVSKSHFSKAKSAMYQSSMDLFYLKLDEFDISYKTRQNMTKPDGIVCLGYVN